MRGLVQLAVVVLVLGSGCYLSHEREPGAVELADDTPFHYFQCTWGSGIYMVIRMCPGGVALVRHGSALDFTDPGLDVADPERSTWTDLSTSGVDARAVGDDIVLLRREDGTWIVAPDRHCEGVRSVALTPDEEDARVPIPGGDRSEPLGAWPGLRRDMDCP